MTSKMKKIILRGGIISKEILKILLITDFVIRSAPRSAYYFDNVIKELKHYGFLEGEKIDKKNRKRVINSFTYLRRRGYIVFNTESKQIYIKLTPEGKARAKLYTQIDSIKIKKQKKWDKKWRVLIFDVPEDVRIKREALRGKLKELGFYMLQKSVWVYPYPCKEELELLKNFFGLDEEHYIVLEVNNIGTRSQELVRFFGIS